MRTLVLVSAISFAIAALGWFFVWAIWIHAPKGWYGPAFSPLAAAEQANRADDPAVRHLAWYRTLQMTTLVLFALTLGLLLSW